MRAPTLERATTVVAAATIGGWLQGRVAGWPGEGAAATAILVGALVWRDQRRRHKRYPPRREPAVAVGTLDVDGTPCRGWPTCAAVAAKLVDAIEHQMGGGDPWRR